MEVQVQSRLKFYKKELAKITLDGSGSDVMGNGAMTSLSCHVLTVTSTLQTVTVLVPQHFDQTTLFETLYSS